MVFAALEDIDVADPSITVQIAEITATLSVTESGGLRDIFGPQDKERVSDLRSYYWQLVLIVAPTELLAGDARILDPNHAAGVPHHTLFREGAVADLQVSCRSEELT